MKNTRWTLLAALVLAAPTVAQAQTSPQPPSGVPMGSSMMPPGSGSMSGGSMGGSSMSGDSGSITNGASTESTTTTSTTGIGPDGVSMEVEPGMETTELANTGGEPVLMSLLGLSMAMGAFALRRRVSA
ncbi:hypothetical protein B1R32_10494 [Abditibacterium utsteinense]|uniref:PEP-CTERM protein-sorting domain-containing protein n=1 Tax=Abditibacterium utsteinense TaxID=1960156 RepID=A0A2S8SUY4_9BACT|nr:hypothetical protein [Abditibacterium utsteinense]PQV64601.1 hypothetical protein B1R32_10494 [Abditibacterium utsteinense]